MADVTAAEADPLEIGRLERQQRHQVIVPARHASRPTGAPCPDHRRHIMDQRQGFACSSQALGDAPAEPGAVDRNNGIGAQALYRSDRLADPPQDQRRPRQHLGDADHREIGERHEAFDTLLAHPLTADPGNLEPITDAESQRSDQCRAKGIARGFASDDKDKRRPVAAVLAHRHSRGMPTTNRPARSAASTTSPRSRTMVAPASTAIPRRPVSAARATVCGPIVGRSARCS